MTSELDNDFGVGAYIGANDIDVEGTWRWATSGDLVTFTDWNPAGEPTPGTTENCVGIRHHQWYNHNCAEVLDAICEFD